MTPIRIKMFTAPSSGQLMKTPWLKGEVFLYSRIHLWETVKSTSAFCPWLHSSAFRFLLRWNKDYLWVDRELKAHLVYTGTCVWKTAQFHTGFLIKRWTTAVVHYINYDHFTLIFENHNVTIFWTVFTVLSFKTVCLYCLAFK